jgi:hypothetical protein
MRRPSTFKKTGSLAGADMTEERTTATDDEIQNLPNTRDATISGLTCNTELHERQHDAGRGVADGALPRKKLRR